VGVDHRGPHIGVAQERLDGSGIVVRLEEMSGEGMPERVGGDPFGELCFLHGAMQRLLEARVMDMIPSPFSAGCNMRQGFLREEPFFLIEKH
jgi:hypothetical protein